MKTKLVPFDIEKAKNGAKIVTRSGLSARRVDVDDVNNGHPVLCLVTWKNGIETPILYSIDGRYYPDHADDRDLFIEEKEVEEKVEETDDCNPYKIAIEVLANMVKLYSSADSDELKDFYNEVKAKCREAIEYDNMWNKKQGEQKTADSLEISPDKWYVCTLGLESRGWDNDWKFVKGFTYPESEILQCYPMDEKEIQNHFRLWTISDAKPGDVLVCIGGKYGQEIGIVKKYVGKYGGCDKCFETYCFVDWEGIFRLGEYMGSKEIYPATKEQRDFLFQKMKEAGYEWNPDTKELKKIDADTAEKKIKTRKMTYKELSWWLREHPEEHREYTHEDIRKSSSNVYSCYDYNTSYADEEVNEYIRIRKNGGEWEEPFIEN